MRPHKLLGALAAAAAAATAAALAWYPCDADLARGQSPASTPSARPAASRSTVPATAPASRPSPRDAEVDTLLRAVDAAGAETGVPRVARDPAGRVVGLFLSGQTATDATVRLATAFPDLRWLNVNCTYGPVSPEAVATLSDLRHLESVVFRYVRGPVTPAFVRAVAGIGTLREVEFHYAPLSGESLATLKALPDLRRLRVSSAPDFADRDAEAVAAALDQLAELDLSRTGVTDACLDRLADLPNLRRLDVSQTAVTSAGLGRSRLRGRVEVRRVGAATRPA